MDPYAHFALSVDYAPKSVDIFATKVNSPEYKKIHLESYLYTFRAVV